MEEPEEFDQLLDIYNRYPFEELILHPRVQKDYYKNKPRLEYFEKALEKSTNPVCYNGDLFTIADYRRFKERFPSADRVPQRKAGLPQHTRTPHASVSFTTAFITNI